ncbi:hypothetical protein CU669_08385 [Paramagnetospirillum kuznetsovii]|uniref:DUF1501 domain-containing protein n=1 Tax=Paramagnetospirillum kuznetsovii TaxID=2053833 RepID=A0A364P0B0_9PROT|nr:DUF1501 domain-containing protein [Paramagnetospirillum kuznetsovii]RAU22680.1 hypothetical protein CU669_08385 [Paramagnetospirillum kuznetsovii]
MLNRRAFLAAAGAAALSFPGQGLAGLPGDRWLVVIILRGGMDGLHAVPPLGDPSYGAARGALALGRGGEGGALDLDGFFGLHPALVGLEPLWRRKELAVVHAVASPYRNRSHFDGQDVLEGGGVKAHATGDGWLGRAVADGGRGEALAVAQAVPLILRGAAAPSSWSPSPMPGLPPEQIRALSALYADDPLFSAAFEDGVQMEAFIAGLVDGDDKTMGEEQPKKKSTAFPDLAMAAGRLLTAPGGPRVAVMELGGWDTHTGQANRMAQPLAQLADGIAALAKSMGTAWAKTVVVAASEFGRTVAMNGTSGTDHGTGGAMFLAGGAVKGGRVIADWPGLDTSRLLDGRDLRPTLDGRSVFKAVLRDHLHLSTPSLDSIVFPDSAAIKPLDGLIG